MSDKSEISPAAKALQQVNDELRKKYKTIPAAEEIGELVQCWMDMWLLEWQQANDMIGASTLEMAERWSDLLKYVNGRPLSTEAIAALAALAEIHGNDQVVAIMDSFKIQNYTFDIIAEKPELKINWHVTDW